VNRSATGEQVSAGITIPVIERTEQEMRHQWNRAEQEMTRTLFHRGMRPIGPLSHSSTVDEVNGQLTLRVHGWAVVDEGGTFAV
jgi:hypothetical protein